MLKQKDEHANPNIKNMVSKKHHELMARLVEIYRAIENIEHEVGNYINGEEAKFAIGQGLFSKL